MAMMDRFYTPYQRRQVIEKMRSEGGLSIEQAKDHFLALEQQRPDDLRQLIAKLPEAPK